MVDLRKWFPALAITAMAIASAGSANAQATSPFQCVATAGNTPAIRQEGFTELVGDIVLTCTGGQPTRVGQLVPQVNILISGAGTNITSRLYATNQTEALLFIDEPGPVGGVATANPTRTQTVVGPLPNGPRVVCDAAAQEGLRSGTLSTGTAYTTAGCANAIVEGIGTGSGITYGSTASLAGGGAVANVYQGRRAAFLQSSNQNAISFQGVPIDPPGTTSQRTLRFTNLRVDATQFTPGLGNFLNVTLNISITPPSALPLVQSSVVVAFVLPGLTVTPSTATFPSCQAPTNTINAAGTVVTAGNFFTVSFTEGFPSAFKPRLDYAPFISGTTGTTTVQYFSQPYLGAAYNTESGLFDPSLTGLGSGEVGNVPAYGQSASFVGLADSGTRLFVRLANNLPPGVTLQVPNFISGPSPLGGTTASNATLGTAGSTSLRAVLVNGVDANGAGGAPAATFPAGGNITGATQTYSSLAGGVAVYEVIDAQPAITETLVVPVVVTYTPSSALNAFTTNLQAGFAPFYAQGTVPASAQLAPGNTNGLPIPRFVQAPRPAGSFGFNPCQTNILFPFVATVATFNTGVSVANTSDMTGVPGVVNNQQTGACRFHLFGETSGGGAAPGVVPSDPVPAGGLVVWDMKGGRPTVIGPGATNTNVGRSVANFTGYMVAQCDFRYGHGFAYITDLGAGASLVPATAEGYVALILDNNLLPSRTGNLAEILGH